jgi:hypothetical protein
MDRNFPALMATERKSLMKQFSKMIEEVHREASTHGNMEESTQLLLMLIQEEKPKDHHNTHSTALFRDQIKVIRNKLSVIDNYMRSRGELHPNDIATLRTPVDRLYGLLVHDKIWQNVFPYLGLMTESLRMVRGYIESSPQLRNVCDLDAKIAKIEELLTPPDDGEDDITIPMVEIDELEQSRGSGDNIAELKERHRREVEKRDRLILSAQLELKQAAASTGKCLQTVTLDDYVKSQLKAQLYDAKKTYKAAIASLKEEYERKHDKKQEALKVNLRQELEEKWQYMMDKETRKTEADADRLRKEEESREKVRVVRRKLILGKAQKHNANIQALYNRQKGGTLALAKKTEMPTQQACLDGLTDLWNSQGALITRILPHELMNNHDFALEFEVDTMVMARVWMQALEMRGASGAALLQTGWSLSAVHRITCGLFPYEDTELKTLRAAVNDIYRMLQAAIVSMRSRPVPAMLPIPRQEVAAQAGPLVSPQPSPIRTHQHPNPQAHPVAYRQQQVHQQYLPAPLIQVTEATPPHLQTNIPQQQQFDDGNQSQHDAPTTEEPVNDVDMDHDSSLGDFPEYHYTRGGSYELRVNPPTQGRPPQPCFNMRDRGACVRDSNCKFSHDPAVIEAVCAAEPAQNADGDAMEGVSTTATQPAARNEWMTTIPCKWVNERGKCTSAKCGFMHPPGTHQPKQFPNASGNNITQSQQAPQQCHNETKYGTCTSAHCNKSHQSDHGPHLRGLGNDGGGSVVSHGSQLGRGKNLPYPDNNGSSLAARISYEQDDPRNNNSFQPPAGPRNGNALQARMSYENSDPRNNNSFQPAAGPHNGNNLQARMSYENGDPRALNANATSFAPGGWRGGRGGGNGRGRGGIQNQGARNYGQGGMGNYQGNTNNNNQGGQQNNQGGYSRNRGGGGRGGGQGGYGGGGRGRSRGRGGGGRGRGSYRGN